MDEIWDFIESVSEGFPSYSYPQYPHISGILLLFSYLQKLNPGIEAPLTRILDQIQSVVDKNQDGSEKSLKVAFKDDAEEGEQRMLLTISSHLAGMPFTWNFHCRPAEKTLV